jgi:hypothetical protein
MTRFPIEHDVPTPEDPDDFRFPWPQMKPGDSIVLTGADARASAHASFHKYRKRNLGKTSTLLKLVTRSIGGNKYRAWVLEVGEDEPTA